MHNVFVKIGGGVWFHEKSSFMAEGALVIDSTFPLHCLVGKSGARDRIGEWPKKGYFCRSCNAISIKK
jgi:hypothetical protein